MAKAYFGVYLILMALLGVTIGVSTINLGAYNLFAALMVSVIKTVFILLIFMHVRHSKKIVAVFVAAGFLWIAIASVLLLTDYLTRSL